MLTTSVAANRQPRGHAGRGVSMTVTEQNGEVTGEPPEANSALAARLRRVGQRVTPQRLVILAALQPGEHLSADEVFARVERQIPGVNRSTVYRTLELFCDLGLVSVARPCRNFTLRSLATVPTPEVSLSTTPCL